DNAAAAPLGQELAALLLGVPGGSMTRNPTATFAAQNKYLGVFFHDDVKLTRRLTVNIGLRYEMEWPVTERYDRLVGSFDTAVASPIATQAIANYARSPIPEIAPADFKVNGGLTFVNQNSGSRSPYRAGGGEWMPRVGLAYQLTPGTVLRSGYGVYFGT